MSFKLVAVETCCSMSGINILNVHSVRQKVRTKAQVLDQ